MSKAFNLTAQINLQGPANIKPIVAKIKRELGTVSTKLDIKFDAKAAKNVTQLTKNLRGLNTVLAQTSTNARTLTSSMNALNGSFKGLSSINKINSSLSQTSEKITSTAKATAEAGTQMQEFGKQSALAIRRFAAFSVVTTGIFGLISAISSATKAFIEFDRQIIRLRQVTGAGAVGIDALRKTIRSLAQDLGVSSESLAKVAVTLAQAGMSAKETQQALGALAKTDLAATFDNLENTTEGAIAAMRQFGIASNDLEQALGSINAVAASFAVESSDIVAAIQRAGGAFAASSKGVSEGTDALNEFVAVFTSVRATSRESAETIATGLRTIFTRIQRGSTIEFLREFGVELQDVEGKFIGPFQAVKRLSEVLQTLDPRDVRFSKIVEELGGFRQIGKVIPLIQQFSTAQEALKVAQAGGGSLADAQAKAQLSLANQIARVREEFLSLIDAVGQSKTFDVLFKTVLGLTSGLLKLASVLKPIMPLLAIVGAVKAVGATKQFAGGFMGGLGKSSGGGSMSGGVDAAKQDAENTAIVNASDATSSNTEALNNLTSSINNLNNSIGSGGSQGLNQGGKVLAFARGGSVPGTGNRDTVPAMLQPGEFVIRKKAVETIGKDKLQSFNKYADGGNIKAGINTLQITDVVDGDTFDAMVTPNAEPFQARFRTWGYDAYEDKGKDSRISPKRLAEIQRFQSNKGAEFPTTTGGFKIPSDTQVIAKPDGATAEDAANRATDILRSTLGNTPNQSVIEQINKTLDEDGKFGRYKADIGNIMPDKLTTGRYQRKNLGGFIQSFQGGGTVEEIAKNKNLTIEEALLQEIQSFGGIKGVKEKLGVSNGDRTLDSLLRAGNIRSGKRIGEAQEVVDQVLDKQSKNQQQQEEAIAKSIKVGVVGLQPLDYQAIKGPLEFGGKSVTMHVSGLASQFAESVAKMRQQLSGVIGGFAGDIQEKAIFGGDKNLRFDFDETLVKGADIFDEQGNIDISGYDDLSKVEKSLQKAVLTPLGSKLKQLIEQDPSILKRLSVLTARPQSNAGLLAGKLQELGIPIPSSQITGVSGTGGKKASAMSELDRLIDDNLQNVKAARKSGKEAVEYQPVEDLTDVQSQATGLFNTEGPVLEATLSALGAKGGTIQNQAIDYASGLGPAAQYFPGIDSRWPTEVKRTLDSTALSRAKEEFERYFSQGGAELYAAGGSVQDTVPALLTPGEFVINKKAASSIGSSKLNKLNKADKIQGYNKGGAVGNIVQTFSNGGRAEEIANEQLEYLARQAELAGKSLNKFSVDIKDDIASLAKSIIDSQNKAQQNVKDVIVTGRKQAGGTDEDKLELTEAVKSAILEFDPQVPEDKLEQSAADIVEGLSQGLTFEEINAKVLVLKGVMEAQIDTAKAVATANEELENRLGALSDEMKLTVEELEAIDYKKSGQAQQDFGSIGNVSPAAALQFRNSSMGGGLLEGAKDFQRTAGLGKVIPGIGKFSDMLGKLPGPIGGAVKALGGLPGAFAAVTSIIGSELIPRLTKAFDMTDSVALSAIGGGLAQAGSMALSLGAIGNQIAGPIGGLIGTIGGAVGGLISGISDGIQTKRLENSIEKLGKTVEAVNKAFKELSDYDSAENLKTAQEANAGLTENIEDLGKQAERTFLEASAGAASSAAYGTAIGSVLGGALGGILGLAGGPFAPATAPGGAAAGAAIGGGIGGTIGAAYGALSGPSELDDEALMEQVGAIDNYIDNLNKLADRQINLKSLDTIDTFLSVAADKFDQIKRELDAGMITQEVANERRANVERGLGRQSSTIDQAQAGALSRAGYDVDVTRSIAEQLPVMDQQAQAIAQVTADAAAHAAAMSELHRNFGDNEKAIRRESQDKEKLVKRGYQLIGQQERQRYLTARLAIATREVVKETEDLLQMYNMVLGGIKRFKNELEELNRVTEFELNMSQGNGRMLDPSRADENVLQNTIGYSQAEVEEVAAKVTNLAGGGEQASLLGERIVAGKVAEDRLGEILRSADKNDIPAVTEELEGLFKAAGLSEDAFSPIVDEVKRVLETETGQRQGKSLQELQREFPALQEAMRSMGKAQDVGVAILEAYNDAILKSNEVMNEFISVMQEANAFDRKAEKVRMDGAIELDRALGRDIPLERMNAPFDQEVKSMTRGIVGGNGSTDPVVIAEAIRTGIEASRQLGEDYQQSVMTSGEDSAQSQKLATEQGKLITSTNDAMTALEMLANDGSRAANALSKIQERRTRLNAGADTLERIFTQTGEEALKMQQGFAAFRLAMSGELDFDNQQQRSLAFQGMNSIMPLLSPEQQGQTRGNMLEQMFRADNPDKDLNEIIVVPQMGDSEAITAQDIIDGQKNPELDAQTQALIKAFQDAIMDQSKANQELADLRREDAEKLLKVNQDILDLLRERLVNIVDDAKGRQEKVTEDAKNRRKEKKAEEEKVFTDGPPKQEESKPKQLPLPESMVAPPNVINQRKEKAAEKAEERADEREAKGLPRIPVAPPNVINQRSKIAAEKAAERAAERAEKGETLAPPPSQSGMAGRAARNEERRRKAIEAARKKEAEEAAAENGPLNSPSKEDLMNQPLELPAGGLPIDIDLSSLDSMAKNATSPGSIYTHDIHAEKILLEIRDAQRALSISGLVESLGNITEPNLPQQQELSTNNNKVLEQFASFMPSVSADLLNFVQKFGANINNIIKALSANNDQSSDKNSFKDNVTTFNNGVNNFGTHTKEFGLYVNQLANIKLPDTITMSGKYTLDVTVSGAAAFQALEEKTKELIDTEIGGKMDELMQKIAKQTNYAVDLRRR